MGGGGRWSKGGRGVEGGAGVKGSTRSPVSAEVER